MNDTSTPPSDETLDASAAAPEAAPKGLRARMGQSAFGIPYFASLWGSNLLHFFGLQVQLFTLQWLATDLTESRTLIGLILAIQGVSVALLSPGAGVAADRMPRRDLLMMCRLALAALIFLLAGLVYIDAIVLGHLFAFAVVLGGLTALSQPPSQTFLFDIVPRAKAQQAVAMGSAGIGLGMMAGPAVAGVLIATIGVVGSWLSAAGGLFIAAMLLLRIPIKGLPTGERRAPLRELAEGFEYVWRNPALRLTLIVCSMSFFNGALAAMRPIFARHVLEVGSEGMGWMAASMGCGNLLGALVAVSLPDFRRPGLSITIAMLGFALMLVLYSFAFSLSYLMAIEFAAGIFGQLWQVSTFAGLQMAVSEEMRGRVMGMVFTVAQAALLGSVFVGRLADSVGDQMALFVFGSIPMVILIAILVFARNTLAQLSGADQDVGAA